MKPNSLGGKVIEIDIDEECERDLEAILNANTDDPWELFLIGGNNTPREFMRFTKEMGNVVDGCADYIRSIHEYLSAVKEEGKRFGMNEQQLDVYVKLHYDLPFRTRESLADIKLLRAI